jgi:hypothetical protein
MIFMECPINLSRLEGIGGWLILFQARMVVCIAPLLILPVDAMLSILFILTVVLCMLLFYMRCLAFRAVSIVAAALAIAVSIAALPVGAVCLAVQLALEAAVIPALFKSRRVKNTFFKCGRVVEEGRERSAEYRHCCNANLAKRRCAQ